MFDKISRIPAGLFLVPLLLSALLYTISHDFVRIGGLTEATFSGDGLAFILGAVCFCSGTGIDLKRLLVVVKRQGVLMLIKIILTIGLGLGAIALFGQKGIFGISTVALVVAFSSINPALYLSLVKEYGTEDDPAAFGLIGIFSIPVLPIIVYSIAFPSGNGIDWSPVYSALLPIGLGMILGNIDKKFAALFGPGVAVLIPLMGWNIGQGIDLIEAAKSGFVGILLVVIYYIFMSPIYFTDKKLLKKDGIAGLSMISVAGISVSAPLLLAQFYPELLPYVASATGQLLTAVVISSIVTSFLVKRLYNNVYQS